MVSCFFIHDVMDQFQGQVHVHSDSPSQILWLIAPAAPIAVDDRHVYMNLYCIFCLSFAANLLSASATGSD